ncbi:DNA-directed RNA polymerase subunit alpha [Chlamydiota bacterium]
MAVKLGKFELPKRLTREDATATAEYSRFIAEPFERGYGFTLGTALRRVLLSSIEGAAIKTIKIDKILHEYSTIDGVKEDVPQIIMNLKKILLKSSIREDSKIELIAEKEGEVFAKNIVTDGAFEVINPDQYICYIEKGKKLKIEMGVGIGRGYCSSENNKTKDQEVGVIPIDSIFTPVKKVSYYIEDTRVGHMTDYDRLIIDVWTDGRISPEEALRQSSGILKHHLDIFVDYDEFYVEFEQEEEQNESETADLERKLNMNIEEVELSVRSTNCIKSANIKTIGDLVRINESDILKYRNFGKKSLNEIKKILTEMELYLGMNVDELLEKKE